MWSAEVQPVAAHASRRVSSSDAGMEETTFPRRVSFFPETRIGSGGLVVLPLRFTMKSNRCVMLVLAVS